MLAEVQQFPTTFAELATQTITLNYDSTAPPGSQFTFNPPQPFLFIDEETTVIVTLQNAKFVASNPITWISPSAGFTSTLNGDQQISISIDVTDVPAHYFVPWILSFNVNVEGANGVTSPTFCLVRSPDSMTSTSIDLHYSQVDGSFSMAAAGSLANLSILTNNIMPFDVTFNLVTDPSGPTVTFDPTTPLLGPLSYTLNTGFTQLTVSIPSTANKFTSLKFVLDVGSVQVTSPDPILVNATIGDG
jgi:hypothetical protein